MRSILQAPQAERLPALVNLRLHVGAVTLYRAVPAENDYYGLSTMHFCGLLRFQTRVSDCLAETRNFWATYLILLYWLVAAELALSSSSKNMTRRCSEEGRSVRSFYLGDKSKFPASLLFGVSRLGSRYSFLATATCDARPVYLRSIKF